MKFRLLKSNLTAGNSYSWPRVLSRKAPDVLCFTVYRWLRQWLAAALAKEPSPLVSRDGNVRRET